MEQANWDLPRLDYLMNHGVHTGGKLLTEERDYSKELRYKIVVKEENLFMSIWKGPYCFEKSDILDEKTFPLEEQGLADLENWLKEYFEKLQVEN